MEKKQWTLPKIELVQFAANEYISTCGPVSTVNNLQCNVNIDGWPADYIGNGYPGYIMLDFDGDLTSANYGNSTIAHLSAYDATKKVGGSDYWSHIFGNETTYQHDQLVSVNAYEPIGAFASCMDGKVHNNVDASHVRNGWYYAGDLSNTPNPPASAWQAVTLWFDNTIHAMFGHTVLATAKA